MGQEICGSYAFLFRYTSHTCPSFVGVFVHVEHSRHEAKTSKQETRTISDPAANELQIAIKATGLCGSDCSYYNKFRNGDLQACEPLSLGHESAGIVVAIGQNVTGYQIGERVALEVGVPCDNCRSCQRGRYNLCPKMRFRSSAKSMPHFQGTLQERINHPAKWCHKYVVHDLPGTRTLADNLN
jgi:L-iditol 2-dehydrogenase